MDEHHRRLLAACYARRPWILAMEHLAGATPLVADLRGLGAGPLFAVAGSRGTGAVPEDLPAVVLELGGATVMDSIRAFDRALAEPGAGVGAALDGFDPGREARVIATPFSALTSVAGRAVHGARPARWRALEDKTVVDALWDATGVPRAPALVVSAERAALHAASARLDRGDGAVWVADNRRGWHGGAAGLRWVRSPEEADAAAAFLADEAAQVRVMPFLDGIPCSIHGMVFADAVIAFRPCEMVVLRRPGRSDLLYAGVGTTWDPPPHRREELRALARRVGEHLRATVGYRGVFTVDGVMTAAGFRPTELNPRFGGAASSLAPRGLPLYLLHLAVVAEVPGDWRPARLEQQVVEAADAIRAARSIVYTPRAPDGEETVTLHWQGTALVASPPAAAPDVSVTFGPSAVGGALRVMVDAARHPRGRSVAPAVAAALRWADAHWNVGLGPLEPAPDLST